MNLFFKASDTYGTKITCATTRVRGDWLGSVSRPLQAQPELKPAAATRRCSEAVENFAGRRHVVPMRLQQDERLQPILGHGRFERCQCPSYLGKHALGFKCFHSQT